MPPKRYDHLFTEVENANGILKEITFMPSTLETIDAAMLEYVNEELDLHAVTNKGQKKIPVIWVSAERNFQIKSNKNIRDSNGNLILPIITIERKSLTKDPAFKGTFQAHYPSGQGIKRNVIVSSSRRIKQDKTSNFANADSARQYGTATSKTVGLGQQNFPSKPGKVVYETVYMPLPTYVTVNYSIVIRTEYMQQMNTLIQPFFSRTGNINSFSIEKDNHRFECFIQSDFSLENNASSLDEDEKSFETSIDIKTLGYLMGDGPNDPRPSIQVVENAVEVKIPREQVMIGDINTFVVDGFYRE